MAAVSHNISDLWRRFTHSTVLMKIIWINIVVFVALRLISIAGLFGPGQAITGAALSVVELPGWLPAFAMKPWTLFTYMFAQYDLLHILFNMLWLYWFGTLFAMVASGRQLLALYIAGGLGGGLLFLAGCAALPVFGAGRGLVLIGSSASVIAIVTATAVLLPSFKMNLLFIGSVSLKWIAIATIVLVLIGVTGSNAGGEIAHLGGIAIGVLVGCHMKRGGDISAPFAALASKVSLLWNRFASVAQPHGHRRSTTSSSAAAAAPSATPHVDRDEGEELDAILDKIKHSGYAALSPEEKRRLFEVSRKIK